MLIIITITVIILLIISRHLRMILSLLDQLVEQSAPLARLHTLQQVLQLLAYLGGRFFWFRLWGWHELL